MKAPQLVLLAGPNGAGKSTFYAAHLADSPLAYLNADLVSARTGIDSLQAAHLLDATRDRMIEQRAGFITETVFSDPVGAKLGMLRRAVDAGYDVILIYIGLQSPALSGLRVGQRVADGGHDVPRDRLPGRFERSLANLRSALRFVPTVKIYDNSSRTEPYRLLAVYADGERTFISTGPIPSWAKKVTRPRAALRKRRK